MSSSMGTSGKHPRPGLLLFFTAALLLFHAASPSLKADSWQQRSRVPGARAAHSAVWTGHEMIVWGGGIDGNFLNTGGRYLPATDSWRTTSPYGAPSPRWFHAAVWTGSEMIIWGGRANFNGIGNFNDGARYDPFMDTWSPISADGAPTARSQCAAVWTGEEMIIWGGATEGGVPLADGAAYNPATDVWRPISNRSGLEPRMEPAVVWAGSEMIVFGGVDTTQPGWLSYGDGARYNPFTDSWTPLPSEGAPSSRTAHTAIWTGERMIVWGGRLLPAYSLLNDGAIYNPGSDTWTALPPYAAPQARMLHAAVWTGTEMIIWGGQADTSGTLLNTGARYHPASGVWTPTTQHNAAGQRMFWRPDLGIWTGRGMLVCAGSDYPASLDSTYLYSLSDPPCPPVFREQPQSMSVVVGQSVTLAVGAADCADDVNRSAGHSSVGATPDELVFETGAPAGELLFDYRFYFIPDSLRVYYDGRRILDRELSGDGTLRVPFGPGTARSVRIVVNEEFAAQSATAWEYTVSFKPPPLRYQWQKDGATLQGETNFTLHLSSVSLADAGSYSVIVANNHGAVVSAVATLTVLPPPQPTEVFDVSRDFSLAANPNGPWSYGHLSGRVDGPFALLNTTRTFGAENGVPIDIWQLNNAKPWVAKALGPDIAVSFLFSAPAGTVYFGPDPDVEPPDYAAIRFTVPPGAGGSYQMETSVRSLYDSTRSVDADFHVVKNGSELFGQLVPPNSGVNYSNTLTLAVGDRIDFVAGRGTNGLPNTGLKIQATLTAMVPVSMSAGAVSFLAAGGVRVTGHAPSGTVCHLQRSMNLIDWEDAGSAAATDRGVIEFLDTQPPGGAACFYRLVIQ